MADQLVGQRPGDPLEQEGEDGVLEDAAVFHLEQVSDVLLVGGAALDGLVAASHARLLAEAQVAEPAGELDQLLRVDVAVALPVDVGVAQILRSSQQGYLRIANDLHRRAGLRSRGSGSCSRETSAPSPPTRDQEAQRGADDGAQPEPPGTR